MILFPLCRQQESVVVLLLIFFGVIFFDPDLRCIFVPSIVALCSFRSFLLFFKLPSSGYNSQGSLSLAESFSQKIPCVFGPIIFQAVCIGNLLVEDRNLLLGLVGFVVLGRERKEEAR